MTLVGEREAKIEDRVKILMGVISLYEEIFVIGLW